MERLDMEYVGFWARTGAALIDSVLLCLITFPLLTFIYGMDFWSSSKLVQGPADIFISWVLPAIIVIGFWVTTGQTPGKIAIGARVVDSSTGQNLSAGKAIVRYLAYFISALGLFIGYLWVGFDSKKRGWHDHIAGTVVIRKKNRSPEPVRFDG